MRNVHLITKHIYITSDEEIKEGDWFYNIISLKPEPFKACENGDGYVNCSKYSHYRIDCKKIILTTDPDLIKDGVQAIDNEFLEWFVKNPSCESVEVFHQLHKDEPLYKIIIPQEEPKQIKCYCGHTITCDCEPLQETLEEASHTAWLNYEHVEGNLYSTSFKNGFKFGAKWQQNDCVQFINKLEDESFDGWSEEAKSGYLTACMTIKQKYIDTLNGN